MQYVDITEPGAPDVLVATQGEPPTCGRADVLVQVAAAGVNRPDVIQRMGLYPPPPGASPIPGLEVAGIVVEVGEEVSRWQVGDRVCGLANGGGYAELVSLPEGQCLPIPPSLSLEQAAALPETFFTVWTNVFDRGRLQPGESLLIHGGSSGIGVAAIQMAVAWGAKVYVTAGSQSKCEACEALGATLAVNYREADFQAVFDEALAGEGFDVILDMVGGDYIQKNLALAGVEGRIVNIAYQAGFQADVNFAPLMLKRITMTGSTLRPQSSEAKAGIARSLEQHIWPLLAAGNIRPVVAATFPLAQAAEAHRLMESGDLIGKIVLSVNPAAS